MGSGVKCQINNPQRTGRYTIVPGKKRILDIEKGNRIIGVLERRALLTFGQSLDELCPDNPAFLNIFVSQPYPT